MALLVFCVLSLMLVAGKALRVLVPVLQRCYLPSSVIGGIAGLETDGKYQTSLQQVLLIPKDDGGLLKSVIVRTVDADGNILKELVNLVGVDLDKAIEEGQISFNLEVNSYKCMWALQQLLLG